MLMMNRIKIAAVALIAAVLAVVSNVADSPDASASPANYDWTTSAINFYTDNTILYEFSGLDTTAAYSWFVETTDDYGAVIERIGTHTSVGSAIHTWFHGNSINDSRWPANYTGPMRVVDNYGNVLGRHYITPPPGADWETSDGDTDQGLKQSPGNTEHGGACAAPPYWALNPDGYHHSYNPCSVQVHKSWPSSYFLLHFRLDVAEYGDGDLITFSPVGDTSQEVAFNLDSIIDYNHDSDWPGGMSEVNTQSFVVVNTGDRELPFIDYTKSENAFDPEDDLVLDRDPHKASFNPLAAFTAFDFGSYSCQRLTSGFIWQSDCESVILISKQIPLTRNEGREWDIRPGASVIGEGGTQLVHLTQHTVEIWDGYNGAWFVGDCDDLDCPSVDYFDSTVYAFALSRQLDFVVDTLPVDTESEDHRLVWQVTPISINGGAITAEELIFIPGLYNNESIYTISVTGGIQSGFSGFFDSVGFGTPLGKSLVFLFGLLISIGAVAAMRGNYLMQLISFSATGGTLLSLGFRTNLLVAAFLAVLIALWLAFYAGFGRDGSGNESVN